MKSAKFSFHSLDVPIHLDPSSIAYRIKKKVFEVFGCVVYFNFWVL